MSDNVLRSATEVNERLSSGKLEGCLVQEVDMTRHGLADAKCADATFRRLGLHDADATGGDWSRVKFTESSLRGARFGGGLFRGCSFFSSELIEAKFDNSTMSSTSFYNARMGNADLSSARIQSGVFNSCELFGVKFARALLLNTRFEAQERGNVTLDRADFSHAVLVDCDLLGANLFNADFRNALLIKVDLRHANVTRASFEGAHLIDVQLDASELEPAQRREIETARVDDPWRNHGFMKRVLDAYSHDEMMVLLEYVIRTYIIEGAQPSDPIDSFSTVLAQLKARHDFPELEAMRVRGTKAQVRLGHEWYDLGASAGPVVRSAGEPTPAAPPTADGPIPTSDPGPTPAAAAPEAAPAPEPKPARAPKHVGTSKRFKRLEID